MKIVLIASLALNLLFIFLIWDYKTTSSIQVRNLELEVRHHKSNADSAQRYTIGLKDSLEISFTTIRNLNGEKEKAHQETVKWRSKYESIRYQPLANDRVRDSLWSELYPSK